MLCCTLAGAAGSCARPTACSLLPSAAPQPPGPPPCCSARLRLPPCSPDGGPAHCPQAPSSTAFSLASLGPQEFDTACALVKSLMQRLLGADTAISAKRIDEGGVEGEPCAGGCPSGEGRAGGWVGPACRRLPSPHVPPSLPPSIFCRLPAPSLPVMFPADRSFLAVVYPTADRLKQLQVRVRAAAAAAA